MKVSRLLCVSGAFFLLQAVLSAHAQAAESLDITIGARYGEGAVYANHREFEGGELFGRLEPAAWRDFQPDLSVAIELGIARIVNDGDRAYAILAGPVLIWQLPYQQWSLEVGTRLTWLTEHRIGGREMGGPLQFTSHLGLTWQFSEHLAAAVRLQHISNASIYSKNPGLDLQMVELRYRF